MRRLEDRVFKSSDISQFAMYGSLSPSRTIQIEADDNAVRVYLGNETSIIRQYRDKEIAEEVVRYIINNMIKSAYASNDDLVIDTEEPEERDKIIKEALFFEIKLYGGFFDICDEASEFISIKTDGFGALLELIIKILDSSTREYGFEALMRKDCF